MQRRGGSGTAVAEAAAVVAPLRARLEAGVDRRAAQGWPQAAAARAALAALGDELPSADVAERLSEVTAGFDLDPAAAALLEVAWLAEHSTAAALLLGLLSGDDGPARPTVAVGLELAGVPADGERAHALLEPSVPLLTGGLLVLEGSGVLLTRRLALPDRVAGHLAGSYAAPLVLQDVHVDAVPIDVEGVADLAAGLQRGERLVWVHARPGTAGVPLAAAACRLLDLPVLAFDLTRLPAGADRAAVAAAALLECGLRGCALVLVGAEGVPVGVLVAGAVPVIVVSEQRWDPVWAGELPLTVPAPRLTSSQRSAVWRSRLGAEVEPDVAAIPLSVEQVVAVAGHARREAAGDGGTPADPTRLRRTVRMLSRSARSTAHPPVGLDDLVLPDAARAEVGRLLDWVRHRDEVAALGPVHGLGGKGHGICALFAGPPGTGKTLAAHVVADSLGMQLFQVEIPAVVSKYIGETEKNLEVVFAEAESLGAVLFFDEADSLFGARSDVKDSRDRYANQEVAYLLQRMEQFDGLSVLATNLRGNLDLAFARRLHFIITFPAPDEPTRRRLWAHHLTKVPIDAADPADLDQLAAYPDLSGGEIRNIVLAAAYDGLADGGPLGMRHLLASVRREHVKLGRRPPA